MVKPTLFNPTLSNKQESFSQAVKIVCGVKMPWVALATFSARLYLFCH